MNNTKDFSIVLIAPFNIDLGIRYISSFLKAKGYPTYIILFNQIRYTVEFLDQDYFTGHLLRHQVYPEKDLRLLIKLLKQLKPKLIGISVTSVAMRTAQRITSEIKKNLDTIVVWGGIHAIIAPEECIQYSDIVCIGEGEIPMWELAENIRNGGQLTSIKNLWIKNNSKIEKNELRPLIEDLDILPFPDFIEEGNKFLIDSGKIVENPPIISAHLTNVYPIMTSRGCLFSCTYCCNSVIQERYKGKGPYLRRRSVENVLRELRLIVENKDINMIRFWDDIFTYDKAWIDEFCSRFLAKIGKSFACYAHPRYTDREILTKLVKSGLVYVAVGLQSGSESVIRNIFNRIQSNHEILDFAKRIKELDIKIRFDLITDNPYETEIEQNETVELLLKLKHPYGIQIYSLCYFPETPLTKKALNDRIITHQDLEQYSSKALNNFHMFLPLSRNKEQLFWNCIKAMAVNKHFPKNLVRQCKRSNLFKRYPQLLVFLGRSYLTIFKLIRIKSSTKKHISLRNSKLLFVNEKLTFSFYPLDKIGIRKRFCLKITNKLKRNLLLQFLFETFPFKTQWRKMIFEIKGNCQTIIYLDLEYPELYFSFNGTTKRLVLLKKENFESGNERLCVLMVRYRVLEKLIFRRFNYSNSRCLSAILYSCHV